MKNQTNKKTVHALSAEETLSRLKAKDRKLRGVRIVLRIALIISTLWFCVFCDSMAALGWITAAREGENWGLQFVDYGYIMLFAVALMTVATVLCLFKVNRTSMVLSWSGCILAFSMMSKAVSYANEAGFYSTIRDMPASAVYQQAIMPTALVSVILTALALMQYFSFEAAEKRRKRRAEKDAPAPKIV